MTIPTTDVLLTYALSCAADVSHGEGHIRRVWANALRLAEHYSKADTAVLSAAAILHDCGQAEQLLNPRVHHALEGARKAGAFLLAQGADEAFAGRVSEVIAAHSSPEMAKSAGLEAQLLFDADKLDMCGAVGLSRALMYALDRREPLYADEGESFYSVAMNDTYFVENNLFTPEARQMAEERLRLSRNFLTSLREETKV